jgi:RNA ligase
VEKYPQINRAVTAHMIQEAMKFEAFPKIPRFRSMIVTEKIDGANAAIRIVRFDKDIGLGPAHLPCETKLVIGAEFDFAIGAQSRKRLITPDADNFGFARWVWDNAYDLTDILGEGIHYGEWWGQGIQRGYGMDHKVFSLFNAHRWDFIRAGAFKDRIPQLDVVPVLENHEFDMDVLDFTLSDLEKKGSMAAPGFKPAEGVVVFEPAGHILHKKTLGGDAK